MSHATHRQALFTLVLAAFLAGCDDRVIIEPISRLHVLGTVTDTTGAGVAGSVIRVRAYHACGTVGVTMIESSTAANGSFVVMLSTSFGGPEVCVKVRALPPGNRPELKADSVMDIPAHFYYGQPHDTVQVEVILRS